MSLSCSCDFDASNFEWWWENHSEFQSMKGKRRKRCCSCNELIDISADSVEFYAYRHPYNEKEECTLGYEIPIESKYMCEECGGLYFSLSELGYGCLDITVNIKEHVRELNDKL